MHNYLWQALVRHNKVKTTRENLEEAVRSMELVESAPVGIQKAISVVSFSVPAATSTNQNTRWAPYPPKAKSTSSKNIDMAPTIKTKSSPKRTNSATYWDYAKTKCYNCNQLGHLSKDCPAPWWEQANSKPLGKGPAC